MNDEEPQKVVAAEEEEATRLTCFYACPLGEADSELREHADDVEELLLSKVLKHDFEIIRPDAYNYDGSITIEIIEAILEADLMIADIRIEHERHERRNYNVIYEVGIRHASKKPTIVIKDDDQDLPFDFDFTVVEYSMHAKILEEAKKKLTRHISEFDFEGDDDYGPLKLTAASADIPKEVDLKELLDSFKYSIINEVRNMLAPETPRASTGSYRVSFNPLEESGFASSSPWSDDEILSGSFGGLRMDEVDLNKLSNKLSQIDEMVTNVLPYIRRISEMQSLPDVVASSWGESTEEADMPESSEDISQDE